jgi:hypothetical protein
VKEGLERPAAFGSKTFSATEQKWSVLEQELYAAFWAMRRWERLLLGHPFYLQTDHRNILQLMKAQAPKVVRWRLQMQQFQYTVQHVPGKDARHAIVDCISRLHGPAPAVRLSAAAVKTRAATKQAAEGLTEPGLEKQLETRRQSEEEALSQEVTQPRVQTGQKRKRTDETTIVEAVTEKEPVVKRREVNSSKKAKFVPKVSTLECVEAYHNSAVGHVGMRNTEQRMRQAVKQGRLAELPAQLRDHIAYVRKHCPLCQKIAERKKEAALPQAHSLAVSGIFQKLSIDVIGPLPETKDGFVYIIVVVDGLSRFVFAEPVKDTTAMTAAQYIHKLSGIFGYAEAFRWDNCRQLNYLTTIYGNA